MPPPRGSLPPNNAHDPLRYYYTPVLGRVFTARINTGLSLLDGRYKRLLEIGFGSGLLLPTLVGLAEVVDGIDLASDPTEVRAALDRIGVQSVGTLVRGDAQHMPFSDGSYDAVVAFSILEHLREEALRATVAEVARVLVPGGRFLVGCPAVHRAMNAAFRAIGFANIEHHHFSSIHDVLRVSARDFAVDRSATLPRHVPLGLAPYNTVLLRKL